MASEPVTVSWESGTQFWTIRNSGRTKTLRIQQYGVAAVPLPPQSEMPLTGENVAVWIPVKPRALRRNENGEAFRLLILATKEPASLSGETRRRTYTRVSPTPATQEALIAYFGSHLSWPPLPAPHVRQQSKVAEIPRRHGLQPDQSLENWARNRHNVLAARTAYSRRPTGTRAWEVGAGPWRTTSPPSTGSSNSARSGRTGSSDGRTSTTSGRT